MFFDTLQSLCRSHKTTPTALCRELGLSNSLATAWKKGAAPRSDTLQLIADHFNVSVGYLLSGVNEESPTFYDKFVSLCSARGISPTDAANTLRLGTSSVANWKKGGHPRLDTVQKVADFFGVPASSLTDPIDLQLFGEPDTAPDPDRDLLAKIHALSESDRALVLSLIDRLIK